MLTEGSLAALQRRLREFCEDRPATGPESGQKP